MQTITFQHQPQAFWDKIAEKYAKKPIADTDAYNAKLARVRALLRDDEKVLEIGCGTGSTALSLAPTVAEITATDISGEMISIAERKRVAADLSNVNFVRADAADIQPGAPFDVITAFSVLHLVSDVPSVLRSVHHQLKPGGLFLSKTVCLGDASAVMRLFVRALSMVGIAPPVTVLSKAELSRALIRAGFDIVESQYFGKSRFNPFIVAQRST